LVCGSSYFSIKRHKFFSTSTYKNHTRNFLLVFVQKRDFNIADEMSIFDQCSERREQTAVSERVESDEIL